MSFLDTARLINDKAKEYEIGNFYEIRKSIDTNQRIFNGGLFRISEKHSDDEWGYAFHYGGRKEMQFNIGNETDGLLTKFRYGVAFSLETDRNFHDIAPLLKKIDLFNEYMGTHKYDFDGYSIFAYKKNIDTETIAGYKIPADKKHAGWFIFFGKKCRADDIDYDSVLSDLCDLLKIYIYIESSKLAPELVPEAHNTQVADIGIKQKRAWTEASYAQQKIIVRLRHNEIQYQLIQKLLKIHNSVNVFEEYSCGNSCRIDALVKFAEGAEIYEIKTNHSARLCIRAAVGQLLEYAVWPGALKVKKLIVVGEKHIDTQSAIYIANLNKNFPIEIAYEQVELEYKAT